MAKMIEEGRVTVSWTATSLTTGRFVPVEQVGAEGLVPRFNDLLSRGEGYVEVRLGAQFPVLTVGFKEGAAVVHLMSDEETTALLVADPPGEKDAQVLVMDDLVEFASDFVLTIDHAWEAIEGFVQTGEAARLGGWCEL